MQYAYGKEKSASHKESPKGMAKAVKNMCYPRKKTHPADKRTHLISCYK
jgi:hypothetical protein